MLVDRVWAGDHAHGAGGLTTFPRLHVGVRPTAYTALVFNDVLDSGLDDERTEHSGTAPQEGVKYAINIWIRAPRARRRALTRRVKDMLGL